MQAASAQSQVPIQSNANPDDSTVNIQVKFPIEIDALSKLPDGKTLKQTSEKVFHVVRQIQGRELVVTGKFVTTVELVTILNPQKSMHCVIL